MLKFRCGNPVAFSSQEMKEYFPEYWGKHVDLWKVYKIGGWCDVTASTAYLKKVREWLLTELFYRGLIGLRKEVDFFRLYDGKYYEDDPVKILVEVDQIIDSRK